MSEHCAPSADPSAPLQQTVAKSGWRVLGMVELANHTALRRHVGRARGALLTADVAARIEAMLDPLAIHITGRATVEVEWLVASFDEVDELLDGILDAFVAPLNIDGELMRAELVLAAAAAPVSGVEEVRLAEEAEDALDQARAERRRVVRDTSKGLRAVDKVTMRRDLADAIAREELFLQYQPKIDVREERVGGAEALVRWTHPRRGLILPSDFIPLAEESGLIEPLTLWVIERAIADQRALKADGFDLPIYVNISGQLLGDPEFIDAACATVIESGAKIGFEITETSVIRDPDSAIARLEHIAKQGVPLAIDDYGAGLSSLAYLKKLPANELKIDKMFVMELTSSHRDPLIVRSTIDLAHAMEMQVTAEGVETPAALALLTVMGCDQVQGFLLSRPLSFPAFRAFLDQDISQPPEMKAGTLYRPASFWKAA